MIWQDKQEQEDTGKKRKMDEQFDNRQETDGQRREKWEREGE